MLNRISHAFAETRPPAASRRAWQTDGNPAARLAWLFLLFAVPLGAVFGRLVQLSGVVTVDEIIAELLQTTETLEPIPSRDGRILSADGRVLARDVHRYDLLVHYRWLEEPADDGWLWQQAVRRLGPQQRRNRERVDEEKQRLLALRREMWAEVAALTGAAPEEIAARRQTIQTRVERIVRRVESRRRRRAAQRQRSRHVGRGQPASPVGLTRPTSTPWWESAWNTVVTTLTTPPKRLRRDPVIVQEELDYHALLTDVGLPVAAEIESHPERYPGLRVRVSTRRVYPKRDLAAHVIGNRLPVQRDDLQARAERFPDGDPLGYRRGDRIGRTGVEARYDRLLHGVQGTRRIVKNVRGEIVERAVVRRPRPGRDVVLTIQSALQRRAEQLLDERIPPSLPHGGEGHGASSTPAAASGQNAGSPGGAVVVLDVHTGAVLAAASAPRFDLNLLLDADAGSWQRVAEDPRRPFFPRAWQMTLPPGSVFKTLTAVALLESGRFDPDEHFFCQGYLDNPDSFRCYIYTHYGHGHGEMDLTDAITQSCNVYFFSAARDVGPHPIVEWAGRFGFGQPTGIDLPGESAGNVPIPPGRSRGEGQGSRESGRERPLTTHHPPRTTHSDSRPSPPWYRGDTLGLAIGQSRLTATPLQIARMMAAVANGGYLVTPHVVSRTGSLLSEESTDVLPSGRTLRRIPGLSEAALSRVREGLEQVVAHRRGTGHKYVHAEEIAIAGKTGTAEVAGKGDHAWFAGYLPAESPRYAFAVVLEHAGSGGRNAGPLAKQLVEAMLEQGLLEPTRVANR